MRSLPAPPVPPITTAAWLYPRHTPATGRRLPRWTWRHYDPADTQPTRFERRVAPPRSVAGMPDQPAPVTLAKWRPSTATRGGMDSESSITDRFDSGRFTVTWFGSTTASFTPSDCSLSV